MACIQVILLTLLSLTSSLIIVTQGSYFFLILHVSKLWLFHPQFVQCLPIFLVSIYGFIIIKDLKIYGTNSALWTFVGVIFFHIVESLPSATITWFVSFLQLQSLDRTIILLEIEWSKNYLWLVFVIHESTSICTHSTPWFTHSLLIWYSWIPYKFVHHFESFDDIYRMFGLAQKIHS